MFLAPYIYFLTHTPVTTSAYQRNFRIEIRVASKVTVTSFSKSNESY